MLQGEHSAILSKFIKLPFVFKIYVLSMFEWPLKTGFTVTMEKTILYHLHERELADYEIVRAKASKGARANGRVSPACVPIYMYILTREVRTISSSTCLS